MLGFVETARSREFLSHRKIYLLASGNCSIFHFEKSSILISSDFLLWFTFLSNRKKHLSTSEHSASNWKCNPTRNIFSFPRTSQEWKRGILNILGVLI